VAPRGATILAQSSPIAAPSLILRRFAPQDELHAGG